MAEHVELREHLVGTTLHRNKELLIVVLSDTYERGEDSGSLLEAAHLMVEALQRQAYTRHE